ncbi:hypothetical protein IAQ61_004216 [Plenodomus lingam]|uniref:uncharacterized protein n=1 Tax=Leptosphaeria maculans TaxID=5022 RepID=UPI0033314FF6|nr:hypothetical protein IAQ61_004216 [Plenodomus lingam]
MWNGGPHGVTRLPSRWENVSLSEVPEYPFTSYNGCLLPIDWRLRLVGCPVRRSGQEPPSGRPTSPEPGRSQVFLPHPNAEGVSTCASDFTIVAKGEVRLAQIKRAAWIVEIELGDEREAKTGGDFDICQCLYENMGLELCRSCPTGDFIVDDLGNELLFDVVSEFLLNLRADQVCQPS